MVSARPVKEATNPAPDDPRREGARFAGNPELYLLDPAPQRLPLRARQLGQARGSQAASAQAPRLHKLPEGTPLVPAALE
eukprot:8947922-Alexandrium_andersonii.AAC.1